MSLNIIINRGYIMMATFKIYYTLIILCVYVQKNHISLHNITYTMYIEL